MLSSWVFNSNSKLIYILLHILYLKKKNQLGYLVCCSSLKYILFVKLIRFNLSFSCKAHVLFTPSQLGTLPLLLLLLFGNWNHDNERDDIQGITKPAIGRLARSGVKIINNLIYEKIRLSLEDHRRKTCRYRAHICFWDTHVLVQ